MNRINKILGFPKDSYDTATLNGMTHKQLDETAMGDENCVIYENVEDFQDLELNTPNESLTFHFWYFV